MNEHAIKKHGEKVVKKVMRYWRKFDTIGKTQFEHGLDIIIESISKQTQTPIEVLAQHTHPIIDEFIQEYKNVPDNLKGYETMISMLYFKYMQKLGFLENKII